MKGFIMPKFNSTHAAWLNGVAGVVAALSVYGALPGMPTWIAPTILFINAGLHAILPDAPK